MKFFIFVIDDVFVIDGGENPDKSYKLVKVAT